MRTRIILTFILIICLIGVASAAPKPLPAGQTVRISAETGEKYIQWMWANDDGTLVSVPVTIYLDGSSTPVVSNYSRSSYLMLNLKPSEGHSIEIYDGTGTTLLGRANATTILSSYIVYFMLTLCFVVMIIAFAIQDMVKFVLVSIYNIVLSLLSASLSSGHGILPYIFFGITILTGVILLIQAIPQLREQIDWI